MKQDIAERWIAAMRSGQYRQTSDKLCRIYVPEDGGDVVCSYCAMGLLAELYQQETGELNTIPNKDGPGSVSFKDEASGKWSSIFIPNEVVQWAGMKDSNGVFNHSVWVDTDDSGSLCCSSVVALNDDARLSFTGIADIIESKYKEL